MAYFLYSVIATDGKTVRRLGQYDGLDELDKELMQHGEHLVDFTVLADWLGKILMSLRGKPKPLEVAEFCSTLGYYIAGGVDLHGALSDLIESATSPAMRGTILELRRYLQGGYSLSESMRKTGRLPDVVISMVEIGEESGSLDRMLHDAARHIQRVTTIKSETKRAFIYPAFTLLVVGGAGIFWMTVVVPKIVGLFKAMDVKLEAPTLALIAISDFCSAYWLQMLIGLISIPLVWWLARRNARFRLFSDRGIWRLPLLGRIVRGGQMAFYYQYLALMYSAGVVITSALGTLQKTVGNAYFSLRVSSLLEDLKSGSMLAVAFKRCDIFPKMDQRMISIGEQTGNLDEQLQKLADLHFNRVQVLVETLPKYLEPTMLLILGGGFAFFIMALLGPLYDMITKVGGAQ